MIYTRFIFSTTQSALILGMIIVSNSLHATNQQHAGYPNFSWDTVPVYIHYGNADGYTDEAIKFIASHSDFVCMEKRQGVNVHGSVEKGQIHDAKRLKAVTSATGPGSSSPRVEFSQSAICQCTNSSERRCKCR